MARKGKSKKSTKKPQGAPKATFSFKRHILPPLVGITVMGLVFVALNVQMLQAQVEYRFSKPAPVATPVVQTALNKPDPNALSVITIPTIGVNAPIIFEESTAEWKVQLALREGVDHFGGTANPGQFGNTVLFGHSSGQLWAPGNYKFVFTLLDKLQPGDQIYIDYQGNRYVYKVSSSEVILPTNLSVLNQKSARPALTLITCTPVGTSKNRLVVHAEQISPVPGKLKTPVPQLANTAKAEPKLPGAAHSSIWHSLFGWL